MGGDDDSERGRFVLTLRADAIRQTEKESKVLRMLREQFITSDRTRRQAV